jgi:D-glycero-D-manno-heptose 1,7-bisphosphate phosphatase
MFYSVTNRLYIFDADTTLRRCTVPGRFCPNKPDEWEPIPWAQERLRSIDWSGNDFAIASNQGGVAKGYLTERSALNMLHDLAEIMTCGVIGVRATIHICPHASDGDCECRKPRPHMLQRAMLIHSVGPSQTIMIGDMDTDQQAAENAGVEFAWIWDFCGKTRDEWREHVGYI